MFALVDPTENSPPPASSTSPPTFEKSLESFDSTKFSRTVVPLEDSSATVNVSPPTVKLSGSREPRVGRPSLTKYPYGFPPPAVSVAHQTSVVSQLVGVAVTVADQSLSPSALPDRTCTS